jgi:hypothetical protein
MRREQARTGKRVESRKDGQTRREQARTGKLTRSEEAAKSKSKRKASKGAQYLMPILIFTGATKLLWRPRHRLRYCLVYASSSLALSLASCCSMDYNCGGLKAQILHHRLAPAVSRSCSLLQFLV